MFIYDIIVATMYVDVSSVQQNGKTSTRYLLRESYREGRQVKHRTIATLSQCSPKEIEAIRLALHHKEDLTALGGVSPTPWRCAKAPR